MSYSENIPQKVMSLERLLQQVSLWKLLSQKIVFTNGVFDLMHRGHIEYLLKAADQGDHLIIGLNSDSSTKVLNKGANRPIQDEDSRALILASLLFVGVVTIFNEETPQKLIESIGPDVLVKGGDYKIEEIAGSDFVLKSGGNVLTIPIVEGYSTSQIEERIKNS